VNEPFQLSDKSLEVLKLISEGHSYSQIVDSSPGITYHDVFFAAEEALWLNEKLIEMSGLGGSPRVEHNQLSAMHRSKAEHPRAYAPWSESEDSELRSLFSAGISTAEISAKLQRQPSAIRSRLAKLGLIDKSW
jgi:hypothetical protein